MIKVILLLFAISFILAEAKTVTFSSYSDGTCTNLANSASIQENTCTQNLKVTCNGNGTITMDTYADAQCANLVASALLDNDKCFGFGGASVKAVCSAMSWRTSGVVMIVFIMLGYIMKN